MTTKIEIAQFNKDVELCLKKVIKNDGSRNFCFRLCCPEYRSIELECPKDRIAIKIPKCFNLKIKGDDAVFNVINNEIIVVILM